MSFKLASIGRSKVCGVKLDYGVTGIGRDSKSGIEDVQISRTQIKLKVGQDSKVFVKSVGKFVDKLNGVEMKKGEEYGMKEGDVVGLHGEGGYEFKLVAGQEPRGKKRRIERDGGEDVGNSDDDEDDGSKEYNMVKDDGSRVDKGGNENGKKKDVEKKIDNKKEAARDVEKVEWLDEGKVMVCTYTPPNQSIPSTDKMACFDLDGTIITTISGRVFPKDIHDWKLLSGGVKTSLKKLCKEGFGIVFFTNQSSIEKGKLKKEDFKGKVYKIAVELGVALRVLISTGKGFYRKPCHGMWKYLEKMLGGTAINLKESFYVGDAAGRPKDWQKGRKKDFSCSDRLFALNASLTFHTPEEFFFNLSPAPFQLPSFHPREVSSSGVSLFSSPSVSLDSSEPEVIVMVGCPGSGKSHFVHHHLLPLGYTHVNRDALGTAQKCLSVLQAALKAGKKVVVDNTNPSVLDRKKWLEAGKGYGVRCFVMASSFEQCKHNETFRQMSNKDHKGIGEVVMHIFRKHFKEPSSEEGFKEIVSVNFVPSFPNTQLQQLYCQYLVA